MSNPINTLVCRVISLTDAKKRREDSSKELAKLNLNWQFLDAVDGRSATVFPKEYDHKKRKKHYLTPMSMGEIACFLSHQKAWHECIQLGQTMLVLEDDFFFKENITEALNIALNKCTWEVFRLHGNGMREISDIQYFGDFIVYKHLLDCSSSAAYLITPAGAQKLLKHSKSFFKAVDTYMEDDRWRHKVNMKAIFPYPAGTRDGPSTISDRRWEEHKPMLQKIIKELHRTYAGLRRCIYRQGLKIK